MKYKLLRFSLLSLLVMFLGGMASADDTYIVAGSSAEIFGTVWDGNNADNLMTKQADGTFAKTYANVPVTKDIQFKVVKNGGEWIGDATGNNVTFSVVSVCDVIIAINPADNKITVTGDGVRFATSFEYESVYAVGDGKGAWLNDVEWTPDYAANKMTKVADDVWEITFKDVPNGFERQIKFTIDGSWTHNFGGTFAGFGVETAAVYNGGNITFNTPEEKQDITARLDLSNFNFETKQGAKFTISSTAGVAEDIYIVAGQPESLFGTEWNGTDKNNQLTKDETTGLYTKTFENVELEAGTIFYKIVMNGSIWIPDGMGNDMTCEIFEYGIYTVTVTYNPSTEEMNMTATKVSTGIETVQSSMFKVGSDIYNLNGQRVNDVYHGVIIRNGKKYINK